MIFGMPVLSRYTEGEWEGHQVIDCRSDISAICDGETAMLLGN